MSLKDRPTALILTGLLTISFFVNAFDPPSPSSPWESPTIRRRAPGRVNMDDESPSVSAPYAFAMRRDEAETSWQDACCCCPSEECCCCSPHCIGGSLASVIIGVAWWASTGGALK